MVSHGAIEKGRAGGGAAAAVTAMLSRVGAHWLQRGWLSANNIVFPGDDEAAATVVDTGYLAHAGQTRALVRHALGGRALQHIINTHLHSDHCGGNAALRADWPAADITVPIGYRAALSPWNDALLSYRHTGQDCAPFKADRFLAGGDEIELGGRRWQVHATPGHDPDALVFFEPGEAVLISGDALWADRLAIIFPALAPQEGGFDETHRTLDLIESLRARWVLPGHGPVFTDVTSALAQSRARLDSFARNPERHRLHAARALAMYHMLEQRRRPRVELIAWMARTPIFLQALACTHDPAAALLRAADVVDRLVADRALLPLADGSLSVPDDAA